MLEAKVFEMDPRRDARSLEAARVHGFLQRRRPAGSLGYPRAAHADTEPGHGHRDRKEAPDRPVRRGRAVGGAYVDGNVTLDQELHRLAVKRAALLPLLHDADAVAASVRDFCDAARARLERCHDFESKRVFLADYVARVVYTRYKVSIRGSVPVLPKAGAGKDQSSGPATLEFRIEGEITGAMLHGRRTGKTSADNRLTDGGSGGRVKQLAAAPGFVGAVWPRGRKCCSCLR
jgi:hypothetical protein